jgi:GDPmannose 4,6-dehydratase
MQALIFGVTGQDGSYLSEFLLEKGYKVTGVSRRSSTNNAAERLAGVLDDPNFKLVEGDVTDYISVNNIIHKEMPNEIYNLAAQSHVQTSFQQPAYTWRVNAEGVLNILEVLRCHKNQPVRQSKLYQASTSEMFGNNYDTKSLKCGDVGFIGGCNYGIGLRLNLTPEQEKWNKRNQRFVQNEGTPFAPNSPYSIAKLAAHNLVVSYRDAYDLFAVGGILFNHESERRGEKFLSRKVTKYVAGLRDAMEREKEYFNNDALHPKKVYPKLALGNLDAARDWGYAPDYVRAMWLMLQQEEPNDYVVGTGISRTVRDFVRVAFDCVGISNWEEYVTIDQEFYRPCEVNHLHADASCVKEELEWKPEVSFEDMIKKMIEADLCTTVMTPT